MSYRALDGVALASGDPIGDPEAWPGAIDGLAVARASERVHLGRDGLQRTRRNVYRRECGLSAIALGDEAVVHTARFSLDGREMRSVRQACARTERANYIVAVNRAGELSAAELEEVRRAAEAWRGDAVERGFSMALSRLGDPARSRLRDRARQPGRVMRGLLHFTPWGPQGLSLDLMRRDRAADNGLNELMIVRLLLACPGLGITDVSLNFAVFRDALPPR